MKSKNTLIMKKENINVNEEGSYEKNDIFNVKIKNENINY